MLKSKECKPNSILINQSTQRFVNDDDEFHSLCSSAGVSIHSSFSFNQKIIYSNYFLGKGAIEQIQKVVKKNKIDLVIFNNELSPSQERNLENLFQCRVLDRTGLILDIFAQRAQSHEGKLQVELAQLQYLSTRLVRGWSHLERQKGGIGLRGPGETQLETDRRLIGKRIKLISNKLCKVSNQRELGRNRRIKMGIPRICLVGYTNAGKTSLFNKLTNSSAKAANELFATLDPMHRKINFSFGRDAILSDTVGFIRDLPVGLIKSFESSLVEATQSDLLIHVIDISDPKYKDYIFHVNKVLENIGAKDIKQIHVYNKSDLISNKIDNLDKNSFLISTINDATLLNLKNYLSKFTLEFEELVDIVLKPNQYNFRNSVYKDCTVIEDRFTNNGDVKMTIIAQNNYLEFLRINSIKYCRHEINDENFDSFVKSA